MKIKKANKTENNQVNIDARGTNFLPLGYHQVRMVVLFNRMLIEYYTKRLIDKTYSCYAPPAAMLDRSSINSKLTGNP